MRRKQGKILRLATILLISGIFVGQWAGIFRSQTMGTATGNSTGLVVADGPAPPPPGPPIRG